MCLDTIDQRNLDEEGFGYKVLVRPIAALDQFRGLYQSKGGLMIHDKWYLAFERRLNYVDGARRPYTSGFHIFKQRRDAVKYSKYFLHNGTEVYRVAYRHGHTLGTQDGMTCIVAKEMKILPIKKRKKATE